MPQIVAATVTLDYLSNEMDQDQLSTQQ